MREWSRTTLSRQQPGRQPDFSRTKLGMTTKLVISFYHFTVFISCMPAHSSVSGSVWWFDQTSSHWKPIYSGAEEKKWIFPLFGVCPRSCPTALLSHSIPATDRVTYNHFHSLHHHPGNWSTGMSHKEHGFVVKGRNYHHVSQAVPYKWGQELTLLKILSNLGIYGNSSHFWCLHLFCSKPFTNTIAPPPSTSKRQVSLSPC